MSNFITRTITSLVLGTIFWILYAYCPPRAFSLVLIFILLHIIIIEWKEIFPIRSYKHWLMALLYPTFSFIALIALNESPVHHYLLLYLFVILGGFDSGAYIAGSLMGKHLILPSFSPCKTWEGFWGGYICGFLSFWWTAWMAGSSVSYTFMLYFTFVIALLSLAGDLFESYLKRRASIKDSGAILPGHGGFLDRFDGMLFAVILFYCLRNWLITIL